MSCILKSVDDFLAWWESESNSTRKLFDKLTDASLKQQVADDHRTLGRVAWHIVTTFPEMLGKMGLEVDSPTENDPVPINAAEIKTAYNKAASSLLEQVRKDWSDETLLIEDEMYGEKWKRGMSLAIFIMHEIHHRGQMTILMRQAGLDVPGVYGPSRDEWKNVGMQPPAV